MTAARLARLVALRKLERERRQMLVEEVIGRLTALRAERGDILARVDGSREATRSALERGVDSAEVALRGELESGLLALARRRLADADAAAAELAERRVAVMEARREERKLERLGERLELRRREDEVRRQEREIDDRVAARWGVTRAAGDEAARSASAPTVEFTGARDTARGGIDHGRA